MTEEIRRGHSIQIETIRSLVSDPQLSELREGFAASTRSAPEFESLSADDDDGREVLIIDGEIVPYVQTHEGYRVYYQPPKKTLLDAARSYVDTQREAEE